MDCDTQVSKEFGKKCSHVQAFHNICQVRKIKLTPESDVDSWFQRFQSGDDELKNEIGQKKYEVVASIVHDYQKLENVMIFRKNLKLKCGLIWQGRYALYYDNQKSECRELTVVDLYTDQSRVLPICAKPLPILNAIGAYYTMVKVDDKRFFMATSDQNGDLTGFIYLLSLDLDRWSCYLNSSLSLGRVREQTRLAVDAKNPNSIAVFDEITIYAGRIDIIFCRMLQTPVHHDAIWLECRKFEGKTAFGLLYNEPDEFMDSAGGWIMGEQDMTPGGYGDGSTGHKFEVKFPTPFEPHFTGAHCWSDQRLYCFDSINNGETSMLHILDEITHECKPANICVKGTVTHVFVDDQAKEIIFAANEGTLHFIYRVSLE